MEHERRLLPGCAPEILVALSARRVMAAAVASGRTSEDVPSLKPLLPLVERAGALTDKEQKAFFDTFNTLANLFQLDVAGASLLLLTLAAELDERIYAACINLTGTLFGEPGPRIGSWMSLLYPDVDERGEAIRALFTDAPLRRYKLVRVVGLEPTPLSQRVLCCEQALVKHVLPGSPSGLPESLIGKAEIVYPRRHALGTDVMPKELWQTLDHTLSSEQTMRVLDIHPVPGRAGVPLARLIATRYKRPVITLDIKAIEGDMEEAVAETLREARLRFGIPMFVNAMVLGDEEPNPRRTLRVAQKWRRALALERNIVLFATEARDQGDVHLLEQVGFDLFLVEIERLTRAQRADLLRESFDALLKNGHNGQNGKSTPVRLAPTVSIDEVSRVYRVGVEDIEAIVERAAQTALVRAGTDEMAEISAQDVWSAARERTRRNLGKLARRVESHYVWDDLVVPSDVTRLLQDFYTAALHRARVYSDWGYDQKHARGQGLCTMFVGESGTGKTMAAEVIANSLNVDLYLVEISAVVSKWIGETEKNLSQLFDSCEGSDAILFFDEGEALFGQRKEIKDPRDRYANMEISYLLSRIEAYDGIVILSTNLRTHIDDAFLRRFQFGISFPMPDEDGRRSIWSHSFPEGVPTLDVDYDELAHRYDRLSGGQIKSIAVGAAMLAAGRNVPVSMPVIQRSYQNEMYKLNRVVKDTDEGA